MVCDKGCTHIKKKDWDFKLHKWKKKQFYISPFFVFLHVPINIGGAIQKGWDAVQEKGYKVESPFIMLQEETGPFTANILINIKGAPKNADRVETWTNAKLYSKYYKGEFKGVSTAFKELGEYVEKKGEKVKNWYLWTVDCPECWKERGGPTNVIFARV